MAFGDYTFEDSTLVPAQLEEVFGFFSKAENLEQITPGFLEFKILTPLPIHMAEGTLIDYKIKLLFFTMKWRTQIQVWRPNSRFVDEQLKGPYLKWIHEHSFETEAAGVRMRDRVDYRIPGWILAPLIHRLFVGPQVRAIFRFRNKAISQRFGC